MFIHFNKPSLIGNELKYIQEAVLSGQISGDGIFTKKCHAFFEDRYKFPKTLLTHSCTAALEMCAILINLKPGDEVIIPSYTFVSTANAFLMSGAKIVFADSCPKSPNIDATKLEALITPKTKAIVVVHYGGIACNLKPIEALVKKHKLILIEDAAHAIDSHHENRPLGSIGHLATFSFHETKNVISGEGGMLVINDQQFIERAEIIREKGTNRSAFFRGEIDKYNWVDIGSSYLPSDIIAAFLYAQLESIDQIQKRRIHVWNYYHKLLKPLEEKGHIQLPDVPSYATVNGHLFYIFCKNIKERSQLIEHLKANKVQAVFHYLSLHKSPFFAKKHDNRELVNSDKFTNCLLRLPVFYELSDKQIEYITSLIIQFYS